MTRRPRKPNKTPRDPNALDITVRVEPHRAAMLKPRPKDASGKTIGGGAQGLENWCIDNLGPDLRITFPPDKFARLRLYVQELGPGGPQRNLRNCFIPTFRAIGIDLRVMR